MATPNEAKEILDLVREEVSKAVTAERERCAQIAEFDAQHRGEVAQEIADDIRSGKSLRELVGHLGQ